jgi:hypothetical protein
LSISIPRAAAYNCWMALASELEHEALLLATLEQLGLRGEAQLVNSLRLGTSGGASLVDSLRVLDDVIPSGTIEYVLAAADRGHVVRLASPSGRCVYVVTSSISKKQVSSMAQEMLAASGISVDGFYTCLGGHCSCAEHRLILENAEGRHCKHLLAVRVAEATGKVVLRSVSDLEVARILSTASVAATPANPMMGTLLG